MPQTYRILCNFRQVVRSFHHCVAEEPVVCDDFDVQWCGSVESHASWFLMSEELFGHLP